MKKLFIALAVAALTLGSCSKADKAVAETEQAQAVAAEAEAKADATVTGQTADVTEVTDDTQFRPGVKVDKVTILDFTATWCGPCQRLKPVFHAAAAKYPDAHFYSVDDDNNPETVKAYGIQGIPTVVFIQPDGQFEMVTGTDKLLPEDKLQGLIEAAINKK